MRVWRSGKDTCRAPSLFLFTFIKGANRLCAEVSLGKVDSRCCWMELRREGLAALVF